MDINERITLNNENTAIDTAAHFLRVELGESGGELATVILRERAKNACQAWTTLKRAADGMGITKEKRGFGARGYWVWKLPDVTLSAVSL